MSNEGFGFLVATAGVTVDVKSVDRSLVGIIELNESSKAEVVVVIVDIKSVLAETCEGGLKLSSNRPFVSLDGLTLLLLSLILVGEGDEISSRSMKS